MHFSARFKIKIHAFHAGSSNITGCPLGKDPHCDFDYHLLVSREFKIECLSLGKRIAPLSQNEQVYNPVRPLSQNEQVYNPVRNHMSGLRSIMAISNGSDWLELNRILRHSQGNSWVSPSTTRYGFRPLRMKRAQVKKNEIIFPER